MVPGLRSERCARDRPSDESLDVAVRAHRRYSKACHAARDRSRPRIQSANHPVRCGVEQDIAVLHHRGAAQLDFFNEVEERLPICPSASRYQQLAVADRNRMLRIGYDPMRRIQFCIDLVKNCAVIQRDLITAREWFLRKIEIGRETEAEEK